MGVPTKALLLSHSDSSLQYGTGLNAIRKLASQMIDISEFADDNAMGDSSAAVNASNIIKDNKVYRICKSFFDLDNTVRIVIATEEVSAMHKIT